MHLVGAIGVSKPEIDFVREDVDAFDLDPDGVLAFPGGYLPGAVGRVAFRSKSPRDIVIAEVYR
jgi:hypothetical protein